MSSEAEINATFRALANPTRREILDALKNTPLTTGELCQTFAELDRCTVMQHLRVLTDAGLVIAIKRGRQRWNHLNALPIKAIHDRWIEPHAAVATDLLLQLKSDMESNSAESIPVIDAGKV